MKDSEHYNEVYGMACIITQNNSLTLIFFFDILCRQINFNYCL